MKALLKQCQGDENGLSSCTDTETYMCDFHDSDLVGIQCSKVSVFVLCMDTVHYHNFIVWVVFYM